MGTKDGSVAPKERINVRYKTETGGQVAEKELPLHLLVTGDFKGKPEDTPLEERKPVSIDKNNFDAVMQSAGIKLEFAVPNRLDADNSDSEIPINLTISNLADLSPDNIAQSVPELQKLLELRESLVALKGPLGNKPAFRAQLQAILTNDQYREQLLNELNMIAAKSEKE